MKNFCTNTRVRYFSKSILSVQYLWRIGSQGLYAGYPHEIDRLWTGLPRNFTHVDAVYENKDRQIVFFIGKEADLWRQNRNEN